MTKAIAIMFGAAALLAPVATSACAINRPPDMRLESAIEREIIVGKAIVEVEAARYTRQPYQDMHPYEVTARTVRAQPSAGLPRTVRFERGWGSAACDLGFAKPDRGDRWVVYFWRDNSGQVKVWEAFPLDVAIAADPSPEWMR